MRELETIVKEISLLRSLGKAGVLATVVDVAGSAYRLPGARMLVTDSEWLAGSISGGCLESDVVTRASAVIESDAATVVTYNTISDDDIVFGVGLGCRGVIRVLLEPVAAAPGPADFVNFAKNCLDQQQTGFAATVVSASGRNSGRVGSRLVSVSGGTVATDIEDADIRTAIEMHIAQANETESGLKALSLAGGSVDVFFEVIRPPTPFIMFGAGHDAMPVVRFAKELGWHVTVVDHRLAYATTRRFPAADEVIVAGTERIPERVKLTAETLAVIMTHNYLRDLDLIKALLPSPVRYVGLLGPKKRTNELLDEAKKQGFQASRGQLQRFYAPAGLDIGSENPEEVALSIVAEMRAVIGERTPVHLRNKRGSIHGNQPAGTSVKLSDSGQAHGENRKTW